jgi:DNA-binding MarR family transcriptional regulator
MSALAGRLRLERTTLTRNLQLLEKKGLVAVAGDDDRRVRRIAVTRKGEAAASAALPAWKRAQASAGAVLRRSGIGVLPGAQPG